MQNGIKNQGLQDFLKVSINLRFAASEAARAVHEGDVIIVIDVLRCCSTIVTALVNGAEGVIPVNTVKEARMLHREHPEMLLAGERNGVRPKGFDLGNSPPEFTSQRVKGKQVILTTTSGTKAIVLSRNAKCLLTGAFLNAEATAKASFEIAEKDKAGISLVPAGTDGQLSLEDFICAGAIAEAFPADEVEHSDAALAASLAFRQAYRSLSRVVWSGSHARRLESLGFGEDVEFCCRCNAFQISPILQDNIILPVVPK